CHPERPFCHPERPFCHPERSEGSAVDVPRCRIHHSPMRRLRLVALLLLLSASSRTVAHRSDDVPPARAAARAWFKDATLGRFIHWGVDSQLGQGEWVMENRSIPVGSYEWLASAFNPVKFDAHTWVSLIKSAGARYITITSRHHDGFSMFATKATRYN